MNGRPPMLDNKQIAIKAKNLKKEKFYNQYVALTEMFASQQARREMDKIDRVSV